MDYRYIHPCYCGAPDCEQCNPGCHKFVECNICHLEYENWELDNKGVCPDCQDHAITCRSCGKVYNPNVDEICPDCDDDNGITEDAER